MRCPFCAQERADLFGLSLHLEDEHADEQHRVSVCLDAQQAGPPCVALPVAECDMDAIYRTRPELVSPSVRFAAGAVALSHALQFAWHGEAEQPCGQGMCSFPSPAVGGDAPIRGIA